MEDVIKLLIDVASKYNQTIGLTINECYYEMMETLETFLTEHEYDYRVVCNGKPIYKIVILAPTTYYIEQE